MDGHQKSTQSCQVRGLPPGLEYGERTRVDQKADETDYTETIKGWREERHVISLTSHPPAP